MVAAATVTATVVAAAAVTAAVVAAAAVAAAAVAAAAARGRHRHIENDRADRVDIGAREAAKAGLGQRSLGVGVERSGRVGIAEQVENEVKQVRDHGHSELLGLRSEQPCAAPWVFPGGLSVQPDRPR